MNENFEKVKDYLLDLEYSIINEDAEEHVLVIENEETGINNVFMIITDEILIIEQFLFEVKAKNKESVYRDLLVKNRDIIHGAFALNDEGDKVVFRDTLQIENLDLNELEGTLKSLEMLLSEYSHKIIEFSAQN